MSKSYDRLFKTTLAEEDPQTVLEAHRPHLLPWVTLMRSSEKTLQQAAEEIATLGDKGLAAGFVVLGGLRYHRSDLAAMLGRVEPC